MQASVAGTGATRLRNSPADRQDPPASLRREQLPHLRFADLPRDIRNGERDGELMQITAPARTKHRGKLVYESCALAGLEQVVEPRIDYGSEGLLQTGGMQGVGDPEVEAGGDIGTQGRLFRKRLDDGFIDEVDAKRLDPAARLR